MATVRQTTRQKRAARVMVNGGTPTQALRLANYAPSVIRKPKAVTEKEGFKEALREYGLTEELVTSSLVEDIEKKPQNRVAELRLSAEILSMNNREDSKGNNVFIVNITGESATRYNAPITRESENSSA